MNNYINAVAKKAIAVGTDYVLGSDSEDSNSIKNFTLSVIKRFIETAGLSMSAETPLIMEDTVWKDVLGYTVARNLDASSGHIDYDYNEGCINFDNGASISNARDALTVNYQLNHDVYRGVGAVIRPHIHFWQTSADAPRWKAEYRIQDNGSLKQTAWTPYLADGTGTLAFTYTSGSLNQITNLGDIDVSGVDISSTVQVRLWRTGSSAETADVGVTFLDAHAMFKYLGSTEEYAQ